MAADVILGRTRRGKSFTFYQGDRATHAQIVGSSGRGKSKLVEDILRQDIQSSDKHGVLVIDPHGSLFDDNVKWCAWNRIEDQRTIHILNPSEDKWSIGFNPLRPDPAIDVSVKTDMMVNAVAATFGEDSARTPLLKKCLRAVFYALSVKGYTLLEATELVSVSDPHKIRRYITSNLGDRVYQALWDDFNTLAGSTRTSRQFVEMFSSTNNRMIEFLGAPTIRNIIGQKDHVLDLRKCMDEGAIVLCNLAPSPNLSLDNARLLGSLLVNDVLASSLTRDPGDPNLRPFFCVIDECASFLSGDVASMLDQCRKFGVHLMLIHQRLGQLRAAGEDIYNAVMTGAQTKVVFGGLTYPDAMEMAADIFLGELDLEKGVETTKSPTVVAQEIEWLESESESSTEATATTSSESVGASQGETTNRDTDSMSLSEGSSEGSATATISTSSHTTSRGRHEALRSVFEERYSSVHSLENMMHLAAARLVNQPRRKAIVKVPGHHSAQITVREVVPTIATEQRIAKFTTDVLEASDYTTPLLQVQEEINNRFGQLRIKAREAVSRRNTDTDFASE